MTGSITIEIEHRVATGGDWITAAGRSNVPAVAAMFGLGAGGEPEATIVPPTRLTLSPGRIVFVTGPSGGGKSTLLRLIRAALAARSDARVIELDAPPAGGFDGPIVDAFPGRPLTEVLHVLGRVGLGDAFVLQRRPGELSDGQRHRFRLACAMLDAEAGSTGGEREGRRPLTVLLADEFGATLDRVTACVLARNLRRWVDASAVCAVAATTHDDLLEPLSPEVLIEKGLGDAIGVYRRGEPAAAPQRKRR